MKKNNLKLYQVDLVNCCIDIFADNFIVKDELISFNLNDKVIVNLSFDDVLKICLFYDNKDYDIVFANSRYYVVHEDDDIILR